MSSRLDPRTLLFMLIFAPLLMALNINLGVELLVMMIYLSPFILGKDYKMVAIFMSIYLFQLTLSIFVLPGISSMFFLFSFSMFANGIRTMLPGIMVGTYIVKYIPSYKWISLFKSWHLPRAIIVPFAVMIRFFPTIIEDYRQIRRAMAFRGIGTSAFDLVKHPLRTFEYILIPILINASQVADDLTVSVLTKGLSYPGKQSSIITLKWSKWDSLYMILTICPLLLHLGGF